MPTIPAAIREPQRGLGSARFSLYRTLRSYGIDPATFLRRVDRRLLTRALDRLRPGPRMAVRMVDGTGISVTSAAGLLGVSCERVRHDLGVGRSEFQRALWDEARSAGIVEEARSGQSSGISSRLR